MLSSLIWFLAAGVPLSTDIAVSPAVRAAVAKHRQPGPELEGELGALLAGGDGTAGALLAELLWLPDRAGGADFDRACDYSQAAGRHPSALHNLATCYFLGKGRPLDPVKARDLYGQAADMGFAKAACALGNMLIRGQGGAADPARGIDLCRRAADAGEPDAQTDYGGYLLTGFHVAKDAVEARRYLALAGARGQANAAFLLGQIYWQGDGVAVDRLQAERWWKLAYQGGRMDAAAMLSMEALTRVEAAFKGKRQPGADGALADARRWLTIAAEKDPDPARRRKAAETLARLAKLERESDRRR